jgi:phosphoglycolate phosphatase-like HAD superfamily hydrolase
MREAFGDGSGCCARLRARSSTRIAGSRDAVMIGDTPWDIAAARKAGLETICVITG